jgi:predicted dinucleotide-binding enzyme
MAVPYAGDDAEAKKVVAQLLEDIGFDGVDIGSLSQSDVMEPDAILYNRVLHKEEVKRLVQEERA